METRSRYTCIDTALFASLLLGLLALLYGRAVGSIGFISDDWDLAYRAASSPFWLPAEQHHYSLAINLLFKGAALGYLNVHSFHLLAFGVHALNCFIIYFLVRDVVRRRPVEAKLIATLFAISPAGVEAVVWCCAIGYVLCAFWILLAVYVFWKAGNKALPFARAALLAVLQLGAFLCWDWGIVLAPGLVGLCFLPLDRMSQNILWKRLYALWPVLCVWIVFVAFKRIAGQDFGYDINTPWQMAVNFITVPLLSILPQFTKGFYSSQAGMGLAVLFFLAMLWTAWRNVDARAMLLLLGIWLLPLVLLGYPQSRYFYLLVFPVYFTAVQFVKELAHDLKAKVDPVLSIKLRFKMAGCGAALGLLCLYFLWSSERVLWWKGAFEQSQSIYSQIEAAAGREAKPLAVINMPDRYGPEGMIWLPYLWRCGLVHFHQPFVQIYTADCLHAPSDRLAVARETFAERYSQYALYEVKHSAGQTLLLVRVNHKSKYTQTH